MNKHLLLGLVAGGAAVGVALWIKHKNDSNTAYASRIGSPPDGSLLQSMQGIFGYPFRMGRQQDPGDMTQPSTASAQRVVQNVGPHDSQGMRTAAADLGAGVNIVHSLEDIWGTVSDWWGHDEPGDNSIGYADDPLPQWGDYSFDASLLDASNTVGDEMNDIDWTDDDTGWEVA